MTPRRPSASLWSPRPRRVRVPAARPDNDVLRAPAFEKNTEKGNLIEMAEGATTLKGLRAQMGKTKADSVGLVAPSDVVDSLELVPTTAGWFLNVLRRHRALFPGYRR